MGAGVQQCFGRDRRDVVRVNEGLRSAAARGRDHPVDNREVVVAEVLHHPRGAQHRVREGRPGSEAGLDRGDVDALRRLVGVVCAQEGYVAYAGGLGEVKEIGDLLGIADAQDGGHQV